MTRNLPDDNSIPAETAEKLSSVAPDIHLAERFAHVDTWVFDLDNTLYPADSDLWPKIDMRITLFMCELFGLDAMSARALQKYYYKQHGTTLNGLMEEFNISWGVQARHDDLLGEPTWGSSENCCYC